MIIRILSSKDEIETLNGTEEIIHLSFRPSGKDILSLTSRCLKLKAIQVPSSYRDKISKSAQMYLSMEGVSLLEGDVWGHRNNSTKDDENNENANNSFHRVMEVTEIEGLK